MKAKIFPLLLVLAIAGVSACTQTGTPLPALTASPPPSATVAPDPTATPLPFSPLVDGAYRYRIDRQPLLTNVYWRLPEAPDLYISNSSGLYLTIAGHRSVKTAFAFLLKGIWNQGELPCVEPRAVDPSAGPAYNGECYRVLRGEALYLPDGTPLQTKVSGGSEGIDVKAEGIELLEGLTFDLVSPAQSLPFSSAQRGSEVDIIVELRLSEEAAPTLGLDHPIRLWVPILYVGAGGG